MTMIKIAQRTFHITITSILIAILLANLYTLYMRELKNELQPAVFGWSWAIVISGSMEPNIGINDLIIVHNEPEYSVGDVITYKAENYVVTHRIIAEMDSKFITKGDANNTEDSSPVPETSIVGKVKFVIPKVGLMIEYLKTPLGMTCVALCGFLIIEISFLNDKIKKKEGAGSNENK